MDGLSNLDKSLRKELRALARALARRSRFGHGHALKWALDPLTDEAWSLFQQYAWETGVEYKYPSERSAEDQEAVYPLLGRAVSDALNLVSKQYGFRYNPEGLNVSWWTFPPDSLVVADDLAETVSEAPEWTPNRPLDGELAAVAKLLAEGHSRLSVAEWLHPSPDTASDRAKRMWVQRRINQLKEVYSAEA